MKSINMVSWLFRPISFLLVHRSRLFLHLGQPTFLIISTFGVKALIVGLTLFSSLYVTLIAVAKGSIFK